MPGTVVRLPAAAIVMSRAEPGLLADRYRLDELVASGGTGQVWRAVDLVLQRPVAVKLLRPEVTADPDARARFRAEARNASRVSHPGVAEVYDYGEGASPDAAFLVMELLEGASLAQMLAAGQLDPAQTVNVIAQVAGGLHAAHSAGIVHCDITPANLLISWDGQVKITDFGNASRITHPPVTPTGILVATPAYLAPERAAGASATPASDLYSLGVVGYECLTGDPPFRGPPLEVAQAHLQGPFPPLPPEVPAEVAALVAALTAKNPTDRPSSALEVAERASSLCASLHGKITPLETKRHGRPPTGWSHNAVDGAEPCAPTSELASPERPVSPQPHRVWRLTGAGLAAAAALSVAAVAVAGSHASFAGAGRPHSLAAPGPSLPEAAPMVAVHSARLAHRPVGLVLAALRRRGLQPRLVWLPTSAWAPGTVLFVRPGGRLPPGTVVTVAAATQPAQQGDQSGDGSDGNGGNDGGGNGD